MYLNVLATVDVRPTTHLSQLITLIVNLSVQHDARDAASRAGPSARLCNSSVHGKHR